MKTNNEIAQELYKQIIEDMGLKSMIFNIEEIKNKMDAESKGPY